MSNIRFIIEHLEPELFEWCMIEYEHISGIVGRENLIFTSIKNSKDMVKLNKFGSVFEKNISEVGFGRICVLDQHAEKALSSTDKDKFDYFVFGGILGDNPAKNRTRAITDSLEKSKKSFETRNLGKKQMPTDVAVYVAKKILEGRKFDDFKFVDELEVEISDNESVTLPFRYAVDGSKIIISEKLIKHLRNRKEF